jgi:hypothetical protein
MRAHLVADRSFAHGLIVGHGDAEAHGRSARTALIAARA